MPASLSQFIGDIREKRRLREQEEMQKVIPYVEALEQSIQREEEQRQDLKQVNLQEKYLFGDTAPEITSDRMRELGGATGVRAEQTRRYEDSKIQAILGEEDVTDLPLAEKQYKVEEVKKETKLFEQQKLELGKYGYDTTKMTRSEIRKKKLEVDRNIHEKPVTLYKDKESIDLTFNDAKNEYYKDGKPFDITGWKRKAPKPEKPALTPKETGEIIANYETAREIITGYDEIPTSHVNLEGEDGKIKTVKNPEYDKYNKAQTDLVKAVNQLKTFGFWKGDEEWKTEQLSNLSKALSKKEVGGKIRVRIYNPNLQKWKTKKLTKQEIIKEINKMPVISDTEKIEPKDKKQRKSLKELFGD